MTLRLLVSGLALAAALRAAPLTFVAGPDRVSLVELYTSEGCSSCPPAERLLSSLRDSPALWRSAVPVSFHVDYWNGGGWTDRLSTAAFTQRQYDYGRSGALGSIYTPCFLVDGREWRPRGSLPDPEGRPGVLRVELGTDGGCAIAFAASEPAGRTRARFQAHAALLAGGLVSRVSGGENRGRSLRHEFAVIRLAAAELTRTSAGLSGTLTLPLSVPAGTPRRAVAVWVTRRDELTPLQAAGGWLP